MTHKAMPARKVDEAVLVLMERALVPYFLVSWDGPGYSHVRPDMFYRASHGRAQSAVLYCFLLLIVPVALAQEVEKPKCSADTLGQLWPAGANHDSALFAKHSRCGELEMCVRRVWRYRWEMLSVRLDQLAKSGQLRKPAGCETDAELESRDRKASVTEAPAQAPADKN